MVISPVFPDNAITWPDSTKSPCDTRADSLCLYTLISPKECSITKTNPVCNVHSAKTTEPLAIDFTGDFNGAACLFQNV